MSKELTPLEHLEFIRNYEIDDEHRTLNMNYATKQSLDIIETALKDYEMEHTLRIRLENINYELVREKQKNDKKLKALEIIKEKEVCVADFIYACMCSQKDLKEYYNCDSNYEFAATCVGWGKEDLTKEEFDLLKEILL